MEYEQIRIKPYHVHLYETAYTKDKGKDDQLDLKCKDELVYNLDKIAIVATKKWNANKAFKSCDAFYENNGNHYYIEFKNQPLNNIITDEIQQKAFNSLLVAQIAIHPDLSFLDITKHVILIIVYKESEIPSWEKLRTSIGRIAKKDVSIQFGLDKYKDKGLFQEVHTVTVDEFNKMTDIFN